MEITLTWQDEMQVQVACDGQYSHAFDLQPLALAAEGRSELPPPLKDPVAFGKAAFQALFPAGLPARRALYAMPDRILLVTNHSAIDAIPWEYAYGPDGFLVANYPFVRGLPPAQRIAPSELDGGLHIVAVPSDPLDKRLDSVNIESEWTRLTEDILKVSSSVTLERAYPPTIEQVRDLLANRRHRVLHFMGHGGQDEDRGAFLCLEKENGSLDPVTARQFVPRVRGSVFLVTLNACVSATPGDTQFSNLAAALVHQKIPYALGMRMSIHDDDARAFSRRFYSELASGVPVEEALFQARLTLAGSHRKWAIGVPVLYTSLSAPTSGYAAQAGTPNVEGHRSPIDAIALPREGGFLGRIDEMIRLGDKLTGDERPPVVTIQGSGGQGKTALAREAIERFAFAWPGGIWAISLENLPSREVFLTGLASFLSIPVQGITQLEELERQVLLRLSQGQLRRLIVLDNVETLIEAVHANDVAAASLAQFIRQRLIGPSVKLLVTSRRFLNWPGEFPLELEGLHTDEGATLFQQSAPHRSHKIKPMLAAELSNKVGGHPLSLRLLGGAFSQTSLSLSEFIRDCDTHLLAAEDKFIEVGHRQRTLYACIETSVRYLDADLRRLFSQLWIFHAPFRPDEAVAIFSPGLEGDDSKRSPVYDQLHTLWLRGLLAHEQKTLHEETVKFYNLLPAMRPYIEKYLVRVEEREELLARFGVVYARLAHFLYDELNRGGVAAFIAERSREDLDRGISYVRGVEQGYYLSHWGWVLHKTGYTHRGLQLAERALEIGQGHERALELLALHTMAAGYYVKGQSGRGLAHFERAVALAHGMGDRGGEARALINMGELYHATGQERQALERYEQALPLMREVGDRGGEAMTLVGLGEVYRAIGQTERALEVLDRALPLIREVGDRANEALALNNMAGVYYVMRRPQQALEVLKQALPLVHEVGDRTSETRMLASLGEVYRLLEQPQEALKWYEQTLPLVREVGDLAGEAVTLGNIAKVYFVSGEQRRALEESEHALVLMREVGDRGGEAIILVNVAEMRYLMGEPYRALELFDQALSLMREAGHRAEEANIWLSISTVFYKGLSRQQDAMNALQRAIAVLDEAGLLLTSGGNSREELQRTLDAMHQGISLEQADL